MMEHFGLCFQIPRVKFLALASTKLVNLEIIGHTEIIIEYYLNKAFITFFDCSKLIRTLTDSYTLIKVDGQDPEK